MKNGSALRRCVLLMLALAVVLSVVVFAYAEAQSGGGVTVEWISSEDSYEADEEIQLTLVVTNGFDKEKAFTYTVELPEEIEFDSGAPVSGEFLVGKKLSHELTWLRKGAETDDSTQGNDDPTDNDADKDNADSTGDADEENPVNVVTIVLWVLLGVVVVAGLVFVYIKHRGSAAMIAIILCAGIIVPMMAPLEINATGNELETVTAVKTITVDGKEVELRATLSYQDYVPKYTVAEDGVRVYEAEQGRVMFEAEDQLMPGQDRIVLKDHENASGGKVVRMAKAAEDKDGDGQPDYADFSETLPAQLSFRFVADQAGTYAIWSRGYATGTATSMIVSTNGEKYKYVRVVETVPAEGDFAWTRIATVECEEGDEVDIRIRSRHLGGELDKFIITDNKSYVPKGEGTLPGPLLWDKVTEFDTETFPDPKVYPVQGQHPRVMFTEADIPGILERMDHEDNKAARVEFDKKRGTDFDGILEQKPGASNYNSTYLAVIEAKAFDYAINKNSDNQFKARTALMHGEEAVTAMINFLQTVTFSGSGMDYRYIGSTLFTAAEVYDWCYDLLDDHEKDLIIAGAQIQASMIEAGFPPTTTLDIAFMSHDAEYQIQQCWLAFAIAVADEYPSIYEYIGGMYFDLFIDARNVWYPSQAYHQGSAYGTYRFDADLWGQWLIYQMTGGDNDLNEDGKADGHKVFTEEAGQVIYQWIYSRRPDGKIMTEGDDYEMTQTEDNTWFDSLKSVIFGASNFYKDPILYQELLRENPGVKPGSATTIYSPVMALILNDPSILDNATGNTEVSNLPLSRYLPTPYGGMIARTGWDWGLTSDDVLVTMQMTQRNMGGHQHDDTGSFQIYHKGLLSGDSGYYVIMGEDHDSNYYKLSVAHNTLSITSKTNPTGVQNDNFSVSDLLKDDPDSEYLRSQIVGQEFGPNIYTPDYTYIAGDIAGAYDDNVKEAIRSMLFLNLELDGITDYPGAFIVFDQIKSYEIGTTKSFLLHSLTRPSVEGNTITITNTDEGYNGKMVNQVLYVGTANAADPAYRINRIGGEGKEFWYDGKNHPNSSSVADNIAYEPGWGRLEISTTTTAQNQTDYMLNVMYVSDADGSTQVVPATLIKGNGVMGAQIFNHVAVFNMDGNNRIDKTVTFTIPANASHSTFKVNVAGMKAGTWTVTANGKSKDYVASEDGGMLYFEASAGTVTITRKNNSSNKTFDTVDKREPVTDLMLYNVNGNYVYTDVKPVKSGDTVLVPAIVAFEIMKSEIKREGSVVTINYMNLQTIVIDTAKKTATVNGVSVDVSAMQISGTELLIPIEAMALLIGKDQGTAEWNERAKCAYVTGVAPVSIPEEKRDFENVIQVQNAYPSYETSASVSATTFQSDLREIVKTLDNSTSSYWAVTGYLGEEGAVYDFGRVYTLETLQFVFSQCKTRIYTFEILVSLDGVNFTPLSGGKRFNSEKTELNTWQAYQMPEDTQARYVKLVGYGNKPDNNYFNWAEVAFIGVPIQPGEIVNSNGTSVYKTEGGEKISALSHGADVEVIRVKVVDGVAWAKISWNGDYAWVRMADVALFDDVEAKVRNTGRVVADNTTVWNMAWANATKLGQIRRDTAIEIIKTQTVDSVTYVQIRYNGYQGWIRLTDLALTADPDDFTVSTGTVSASGGANVYNRSTLNSIVMGNLPAGTAIEILEIKDVYGVIYGRIIYETLEGWVNLADIEIYNPNPPFYKEIEAENVTLHQGTDSSMLNGDKVLTSDVVTIVEDVKASGGYVAKLNWGGRYANGTVTGSTDLTANPAHLSFTVEADRTAIYYVWVRYKSTTDKPTISSYIDGTIYCGSGATSSTGWLYDIMGDDDYNSIVSGGYVWYRLAICDWEASQTYTVRLRGRDGNISYDKFVVTTDPGFVPSMENDLKYVKVDTVIEAEDVTLDPLRTDVISDESAGCGKYIQLERTHLLDSLYTTTTGIAPAVGFRLTADKAGTYYVWGRFTNFATLYAAISGYGSEYIYKYYKPDQKMEAKVDGWYLIGTYDVTEAGESIYVRMLARNGKNMIDEFYVTADSTFVGMKPHYHTYSSKWSSDATYHWYASACGHDDKISGMEEHIFDDDMDTTCNTCGYIREVHPHTFSEEWTSNHRYHWHASTCGCPDKVSGKTAHTYGADKRCTVCGAEFVCAADSELTYIEAEDADLFTGADLGRTDIVEIVDNSAASSGKVAQWAWNVSLAYGDKTDPGSADLTAHPAHISFDVKATADGLCYIWARVSLNDVTDIWTYIDGNTYKGQHTSASGTGWEYDKWATADYCSADESEFVWVRIAVCEWTAGNTYTVRLRARNGSRIVFDQFVVTMDNTYAPNLNDSQTSFDTDTAIEAEDTTLDMSRVNITEDATAENESYVHVDKTTGTTSNFLNAAGAPGHITFQVRTTAPGKYYVWGNFVSYGTMYTSISAVGAGHTYAYYKPEKAGWCLIGTYEVTEAGEIIVVRLLGRNGTNKIDQFYVTADSAFTGLAPHEHSYSEEWSTSATEHWHAAICDHQDKVTDKGEHVYDDEMDATCNTCGYTRNVHLHTYSDVWSKDDTHHWHASTCGCAEKVADKEKHTFGADKLCTVCGAELVYVANRELTYIEAEDVNLFTWADGTMNNVVPVVIADNEAAVGKKVAQWTWNTSLSYRDKTASGSADLTAYPAHISFDVKATADGLCYIWARVSLNDATDIWTYIDGNIYKGQHASASGTGWESDKWATADCCSADESEFVWVRIAVCEWTAGNTYTVRLRARNGSRIVFDQFVVTMDNTYAPNLNDSQTSFDTDTAIEAEDTTLDMSRVNVTEDATAENGEYVYADVPVGTTSGFLNAAGAPGHITFQVRTTAPGKYYVWGNFVSYGTMYTSISAVGAGHTYAYYKPEKAGWCLIGTYEVTEAGEIIVIRLLGRNGTNKIDQFYVTADSAFTGIAPHEHTYSTEWSMDESYHWHAATCGHEDVVTNKGEHVYDDDMDTACNTCGHPREVHVHTYSTEWSKDDTHHWHASTCGCSGEVSDKAEHTYGADKLCTVCGAELVYVANRELTYIEAEDVELITEKDATFGNQIPVRVSADESAIEFGVAYSYQAYTTVNSTDLESNPAHLSFTVSPEATGTYYIWAKAKKYIDGETDFFCYIDGITKNAWGSDWSTKTGWQIGSWRNKLVTTGYEWVRIATCEWTEGETYSVRLRGRKQITVIDQFMVTSDTAYSGSTWPTT